ncbi:MAG: NosD domain-containing protein [Acidimicrobiales bacterium]|nr:NosD domain-containing protein [Acidimicrobiales bacterium]
MRGLGVSGPAGTSCFGLAGFSVQDGATLRLDAASVRNCTEIGMFVGFPSFLPFGPVVGQAAVIGTDITGTRIAGIRAAGPGTTLTVSASKVLLPYAPEVDGQVGISIVDGALGNVTGSTVSGGICDHPACGPDFLTQLQGTGLLALGAAPGTVISQNLITNNDIGIAVGFSVDCCRVSQNTLRDNRYYGIAVADGRQTISSTTVTGGLVGVVSVSFDAPTTATLDQVVITGAATPVQELSCCGFPSTVEGSYFIR